MLSFAFLPSLMKQNRVLSLGKRLTPVHSNNNKPIKSFFKTIANLFGFFLVLVNRLAQRSLPQERADSLANRSTTYKKKNPGFNIKH